MQIYTLECDNYLYLMQTTVINQMERFPLIDDC